MDTFGEFLKFLFLTLHRRKIAFQLRDYRPWHELVYRLKRSPSAGKPLFFNDLWFDWDGPYPKSPELEELLTSLSITGAVETTSPSFQEWHLNESLVVLWSPAYTILTHRERQFLDLAVALAEEEFKAAAPRVA